jgi:two-component system, chemotaxis family, sensor kinase CheA
MDDMMSLYIDDTREFLAILNESIIAFERHPDDHTAISEMFRAYHTMKSSTAAMDFKRTADFIHHMEDLLHEMREGRIKISTKIIGLLYESYDYLEKFLQNVLKNGREGDLPYELLLKKVEKFIQECLEKPDDTCKTNVISSTDKGFIIGEEELLKAKKEVSGGSQLCKVTVELMADCAFKAVRAWMTFEDITKTAKIIASYPSKPESDDFLNGTFSFNETKLLILVASDLPLADLFQELTGNLSEVENLLIEGIEPGLTAGMAFDRLPVIPGETRHYVGRQDESVSSIIDRIIGEENNRDDSDQSIAVLDEIKGKIKECEFLLLEFEVEHYSADSMSEIMSRFQSVREMAGYVKYGMIPDIVAQMCSLMELFIHQQLEPDMVSVGLIADLMKYIRRLCEKPELNDNEKFYEEVDQRYSLLQNYHLLANKLQSQKNVPGSVKLGEILVETGLMNHEDVTEIMNLQKDFYPDLKFGEIAVKENKADVKDVIGALHVQENAKSDQRNQSYIRIPAGKVDNLVDHLGELLITQSLHKQEITSLLSGDGSKVMNNIIRMERIAKEIQDITMSLRMVSLKQTFQKIYRIGRDTAAELGKEIVIDTFGEDTEIDRNIVDKLHDPLMHLIRNAISHGIEEADERTGAGKPPVGHVTISASNRKGNVFIEIRDDGKGLSADKIYKKAVEKGLIDPSKKYTEEEILKFVYLPGFSTQEVVNSISGRGVGMNVVQTEIVKLGGKIDIENRQGQGCSFILKIPVNLATINGTIVEIFGSNYIIPTLSIKQILKPQENQWVSIKGIVSNIVVRNEIIPVIPIADILYANTGFEGTGTDIVITVEHEQKLMALPVKAILGKQEVVVKQLGGDFSKLDFISGATILGDGRVSLILDVEALFKMTEEPVKAS